MEVTHWLHTWCIAGLLYIGLGGLSAMAQTNRFRVMEYNVENLFDCEHDSLKDDTEFLPDGSRKWTYGKYRDKLVKLGKVIVAVGEEQVPDLVALCEVENEKVLVDLTRRTPLKEVGYRFLVTDSPDERGIDVALLYQPGRFRVVSHRNVRASRLEGHRPTRDILHVTGQVSTGDTLDVFVCHFPSRATGARRTQPYRRHVARFLKSYCDSLLAVRQSPRMLIMGDFNDTPDGELLHTVWQADKPGKEHTLCRYYNMMAGRRPGTYRYHGEWSTLDQFLVSGLLLDTTASIHTSYDDGAIVAYPFLLEPDVKYGGYKPFRTHLGPRYVGGYSDHLPIRVDFYLRGQ